MPLTNIDSDWMSNAFSGLCIILLYWVILFTWDLLVASWGVTVEETVEETVKGWYRFGNSCSSSAVTVVT